MADLTTYYAKTHAGEARLATKEMTPLEVGEHLAAIADSADTVTLPNFPSRNIRDSKAMFYIDDNGTGVAAPFSGRRDGAIMINTAFSPTGENAVFVDKFLGGPPSSMSGLGSNAPSAQPRVSVVKNESLKEELSSYNKDVKKNGAAMLLPAGSAPKDDIGGGLLRRFLLGTRGVLEGVGGVADYVRAPLNSLNGMLGGDPEYFRNPGVMLSDAIGLPVPENDTERSRAGFSRGAAGALAESAAGGGIAQYGAGKAAEFGKFLADSPFLNGTLGGILGYFTGGER